MAETQTADGNRTLEEVAVEIVAEIEAESRRGMFAAIREMQHRLSEKDGD